MLRHGRTNTGHDRRIALGTKHISDGTRWVGYNNRDTGRNITGNDPGFDTVTEMLRELTEKTSVYIVTGYTDMRKGIDGLAEIISGKLQLDPFDRSLFLFCGKNSRKLKGLLWEGDGFLLLNKRLENGRYRWPRNETEAKVLTAQQIRWLMEGLEIEQSKAIKPAKPGNLY